jgi:hypothetical protein
MADLSQEDIDKYLENIKELNKAFESNRDLTRQQYEELLFIQKTLKEGQDQMNDTQKEHWEKSKVHIKEMINNVKSTGQAWHYVGNQLKDSGKELEFFLKNTTQQYKYAEEIAKQYLSINKRLGITGDKANAVRINFKDALPDVIRMGGTAEEMAQMYQEIGEQSGRQVVLSSENLENIMAFQKSTAIATQTAGKLYERFTLMGKGIDDSHKMLNELVNSSNKLGINSRKVLNVLATEMDYMQRMSFKSGVKGMTEMAKLAVKMRMDVSEMLGMADKFYEPEAAIEAAAQLQLMGGDIAAAFGDPFETMYLARNKPEELAKRLETMTENMIEFNDETGEYELPPEARQQLQFAAEQLGISKDNIIDIAFQSSKIKDLKMNVSGNITDDDMRETLAGMAQMKDGQWKVDVGGEQVAIADITQEQADKLKAFSDENIMKTQAMATQTNTDALKNNTDALKAETIRTVPIYEMASEAFKEPLQELGTGIGKLIDVFGDSELGKGLKIGTIDVADEFGTSLTEATKEGFVAGVSILDLSLGKTDDALNKLTDAISNSKTPNSLGGVLERGGVLKGATHSEGGIPFKVGGVPGFEAEHNEIILTKGVFEDPVKRKIASDLNVSEGGVSFAKGGVPSSLSDMSVKAVSGLQTVYVGGNVTHSLFGEIKLPPLEVKLNGLSETTKLSEENERQILAMIKRQITEGDGIYDSGKTDGKTALVWT